VTGEIDGLTLRELNRPVEERIEQIKVNLERLRWMPRVLESDRIMINVPSYTLTKYKSGRVDAVHRVLVGQQYSPTPILHAELEYIVFSPSWNIPGPIFYRELLPKARKDPDFLKRNGYELYATVYDVGKAPLDTDRIDWNEFSNDYPHFKVIQRPGPGKEEGHMKYMLPNDYNIFLSDASSEDLFERASRDLNYRCISVDNATSLAVNVLSDRKWKEGKVKKSMQSEVPVKATLKQKIPVYITYMTAWVDENGQLNFRRDIYGYDGAQYQLTQPENVFDESDF
jgi:murein L,D-transpeptidase YcbB/YkuD